MSARIGGGRKRQRKDDVFRTTGNQSAWSYRDRACLTLQVKGLNLIWSQSKKKGQKKDTTPWYGAAGIAQRLCTMLNALSRLQM